MTTPRILIIAGSDSGEIARQQGLRIGMLEQLVHIRSVIRTSADTDACADVKFVAVNQNRFGQGRQAFFSHHDGLADFFHILQNDGELIPAHP